MMKTKLAAFLAVRHLYFYYQAVLIKGADGSVSETTGWRYNEPENGGFEVISGNEQETGRVWF